MLRVDQAVNSIKEMILANDYNEQGYLLSEGELSTKLGFSRATIREAVRSLEVRGFLKRIHGKGIQVCDNSANIMIQTMHDMFETENLSISEILEVRTIIEINSVQLACTRATDQEIAELRELVECMEATATACDAYWEWDFAFHKKLVECSKNKMLIAIVSAYSNFLRDIIRNSISKTTKLERNEHFHRNIYEALCQRNKADIEKNLRAHFKTTATNLLGEQ